jgi:hypothetical protein
MHLPLVTSQPDPNFCPMSVENGIVDLMDLQIREAD